MSLPVIAQLTAIASEQEWDIPDTLNEKNVLIYNKSDTASIEIAFTRTTGVVETGWFELPPCTPLVFPISGGYLVYRGDNAPFQLMQVA